MRKTWLEFLLFELSKSIGIKSLLFVEIPDSIVEDLADDLDFLAIIRHLNYNAEGVKSRFQGN